MNRILAFSLTARLAAFLVSMCVSSSGIGGPLLSALRDVAQPVTAECVETSVQDVDAEKIVFALKMLVDAGQDLELNEVTLANLRFNGLPVFAAPLQGPIHLTKGQKVDLPRPLLLTVYLHDVSSTKPLSQALQDGFAMLDGELYVAVHLSPVAKIVLHTFQAVIPIKLGHKVTVIVPGGSLAKTAAIATLEAADLALTHLLAGVSASQGMWPGLRRDAIQQYAPAAFAIVVTYTLMDLKGNEVPLTWGGVAFRCSPTQIVLPYEALEPWNFDPDMAVSIQGGAYKLVAGSFRLSLWPSGQATPGPLTTDEGLRLGKQLQAGSSVRQLTTQIILLNTSHLPLKGKVDLRASNTNIGLLKVSEPVSAAPAPKFATNFLIGHWDIVALLRFPRLGSDQLTAEVILTSASLDHGRIRLGVNVDSTVFGSPIIAPDGIIGMVQDESSGVPWNEVSGSLAVKAAMMKR